MTVQSLLRLCHTVLLLTTALCVVASPESYRAAVVEHTPHSLPPLPIPSPQQALSIIQKNLIVYERHVIDAVAQGAQIIVFPEDGLFGDNKCTREQIDPYLQLIPDIGTNPCVDNSPSSVILSKLSCLARANGIVVVFDLGERLPCKPGEHSEFEVLCPPDGQFQFNAQVALSETGAVLGHYRKTHLFYEPQYNPSLSRAPAQFTTSFNVTFGMLICFDLMFGTPAAEYLQKYGINNIVYSTWWINTPPYFSASQYQQAWSHTFQSNLLAAGNGEGYQYSGSGIFSRGVALNVTFNPTASDDERLLVADVPVFAPTEDIPPAFHELALEPSKAHGGARVGHPLPFHCPSSNAVSASLDATTRSALWETLQSGGWGNTSQVPFTAAWTGEPTTVTASVYDLTCTATYTVAAHQPYLKVPETWVLVAYHGQYDNTTDFYTERFCALFRCLDPADCLYDFVEYSGTIFTGFEVVSTLAKDATLFGMASTTGMQNFISAVDTYQTGGRGVLKSISSFDDVLLNASLFSRILQTH